MRVYAQLPAVSSEEAKMTDGDALEQTQYIQQRVYNDPSLPPSPLDLHSAAALGNYECVQEAINSKQDINRRNKG